MTVFATTQRSGGSFEEALKIIRLRGMHIFQLYFYYLELFFFCSASTARKTGQGHDQRTHDMRTHKPGEVRESQSRIQRDHRVPLGPGTPNRRGNPRLVGQTAGLGND